MVKTVDVFNDALSHGYSFCCSRGPIGIGRSLTAPLLPHHRAYGSRSTAVRLIMSASLPTGGSVSSVQHEHHSFEQLRFRQLYSHYTKGLLTTSTVRAFGGDMIPNSSRLGREFPSPALSICRAGS